MSLAWPISDRRIVNLGSRGLGAAAAASAGDLAHAGASPPRAAPLPSSPASQFSICAVRRAERSRRGRDTTGEAGTTRASAAACGGTVWHLVAAFVAAGFSVWHTVTLWRHL